MFAERSIRLAIAYAFAASSLSACSNVQVDGWAGQALSTRPEVAAFQQSVYPISRKYCISCHRSDVSPTHAADDPDVAFDSLVSGQKINWQLPDKSRIVHQVASGHNCWSGNCQADAAQIAAAIQKMIEIIGPDKVPKSEGEPTIFTSAKVIPADLPDSGNDPNRDPVISFDVSDLFSPALAGAQIDLRISKLSDNAYRISNPVIKASSALKIHIKNMNILLNGEIPINAATYRYLDAPYDVSPTPVLLSPASGALLMDRGPGRDSISLGFEYIGSEEAYDGEGTDPSNGGDPQINRYAVAKNIFLGSCVGCHANAQATDRPYFGSGFNSEDDFKRFMWKGRPFVKAGDAANSVFYQAVTGTGGIEKMPKGGSLTQSQIDAISDWIQNATP